MRRVSLFQTLCLVMVAIFGLVLAAPNIFPRSVLQTLPQWIPKNKMVLGLDLQGGSHLLIQIQQEGVLKERIEDISTAVRSKLFNQNQLFVSINAQDRGIIVQLSDPTQSDRARAALDEIDFSVPSGPLNAPIDEVSLTDLGNGRFDISFTQDGLDARLSSIVAQSIEVVRNRIDELGTTEPTIQRQGNDRILVQVPGFEDSERLKEILRRTARMTFHLVHPTISVFEARANGVPAGYTIAPDSEGGEELIAIASDLGGERLANADSGFDQQQSQWIVSFRFDTQGGQIFSDITTRNVGNRFAIVLDDTVISAPVIQDAITGGSGQISGNFDAQSASDLAVLLRAGALPAEITFIEERSVGPTLGADNIQSGQLAGIIGAVLVVAFMLMVYNFFGIVANLALLVNVGLIIGTLSLLGATLTLPGIAGIVLTMGMAVDANVLIFERIKEEKRNGRSLMQSVQAGFERALVTILDANITTMIAAAILFFLGSGPIKGFSVTLAIGILTTVFAAYYFTRMCVYKWVEARRPKKLPITTLKFLPENNDIKFMSVRKIAFVFSTVVVLGSVAVFGLSGLNTGIDFKGGSALELRATDGVAEIGTLRSELGQLGLGDVQIQAFGSPSDVLVRIETQPGGDEAQQETISKVIGFAQELGYEIRRAEVVGPTVSGELTITGIIAVLAAVGAVLVYIWFRFEWQYALGAVAALVHDVILTLGMFSLTGFEFNLASIAAILTIVGYSLNDTVVVYDRVRENLRKFRKLPLIDLLNNSINQMLSRTILTSITTLLALGSLFIFGGEALSGFIFAMIWGVLVGTYSSIFIAAPILNLFKLRAPKEEENKPEVKTDGAVV